MYKVNVSERALNVDDNLSDMDVQSSTLMSKEYGMKMTLNAELFNSKDINNISQEMFLLPQKKTSITIMHSQKMYEQIEISDTSYDRIKNQNNDPFTIIGQIAKSKYKSLGRSTIDGVDQNSMPTSPPSTTPGG